MRQVRLWLLRRRGVQVTATATGLGAWYASNPRGPGLMVYTVQVSWTDADGPHTGDRQYAFWGKDTSTQQDFLGFIHDPGGVVVRFPRGRPHRFALDIPFSPRMSDQLL